MTDFVKKSTLAASLMLTLGLVLFSSAPKAASEQPPLGLEVVIYEIDECGHCNYFKNRVARVYQKTEYAEQVPLRVINLENQGTGGYALKSSITAAPTIVIFKKGREVQRFGGALARDRFFALIKRMIEIYG